MFKNLLAASALSFLSYSVLALTQAHVDSGEVGQGFLIKRLNTCYLISPAHVIGDELFAYIKTNKSGTVGEAEPLDTFGYDLSLLSIQGSAAEQCNTDINSFSPIDDLLAAISTASVSSVNQDGSETLTPVNITDKSLQYFRVVPSNAKTPLYKGLSGSVVYAGRQPIGILQAIDADTQEGVVLRIDRAISTIRPFFESSFSYVKERSVVTAQPSDSQQLVLQPLDWSASPSSIEQGIGNLMDNDPETTWSSPFNGVYELSFAIGNGELESFNQLKLHVLESNLPQSPKDFEILISQNEHGSRGWRSVSSDTFLKNQMSKVVNFAPAKARRLKLRFYSNWGSSEISLAEISLYNQ